MSFLSISDKDARDKILLDKETLKHKIRNRFIVNNAQDAEYRETNEKLFSPITGQLKTLEHSLIRPRKERKIYRKRKKTIDSYEEEEEPIEKKHMSDDEDVITSLDEEPSAAIPKTRILATFSPPLPKELPIEIVDQIERMDDISKLTLKRILHQDNGYDKTYSIRYDNEKRKLMLGNKPIEFAGNRIRLDNKDYGGSPGLWELLALENPTQYTQQDLALYEQMLEKSNAIYHKYDSDGKPKSNRGLKYNNIIKPIYQRWKSVKEPKLDVGSFMETAGVSPKTPAKVLLLRDEQIEKKGFGLKKVESCKSEIVYPMYYNDINKIIYRLEILAGSKRAGNTSNDNEIINILNELRKENVIDDNKYHRMLLVMELDDTY